MSFKVKSKNVCVFCGSQEGKNKKFLKNAYNLASALSKKKYTIIFGGGMKGIMGEISKGVLDNNGKLVSVVPEYFDNNNLINLKSSKIIKTKNFYDRKKIMISKADIFICLPGGFGTLDELFEVITLNQLRVIDKKIIIMNIANFWHPMKILFQNLNKKGFLYDLKRSNIFFETSLKKTVETTEYHLKKGEICE